MDSLKHIPSCMVQDFDLLRVADLTTEERTLIKSYVGLTRDVIEANQLFEVFYFNLMNMRNSFVFNLNDTVSRTVHCPNNDSDFIAVNSLVINLISSAKSLTEFLREAANRWLGNTESENSKYKDKFNLYVSHIYDTSFIYRFLINLRNFMQHGYLPISFSHGRYSFDVQQILETPHFEIKGQFRNDMKDFMKKCAKQEMNPSCLALTLSVAYFTVDVVDIYKKFLFYIRKCVSFLYNGVKRLVQSKPSIVCDYSEEFRGSIIYERDEYAYHAFYPSDNPNILISNYEKREADIFKYEKQALDVLVSHVNWQDG